MTVSHDFFDKTDNYTQVEFHEKRTLLDAELNLIQQLTEEELLNTYNLLIGDAFTGDDYKIVDTAGANQIVVKQGTFFSGKAIRLHEDVTVTGLTTPSGSDRTDVVFAEWYLEDIDSADDPDIIHPDKNSETATRKKINVSIKVRENSTEPNPTAGRNYFTLGYLNRLDGNANVASSMIEDKRTATMNSFVVDGLLPSDGGGLNLDVAVGQALIGNVNHFLEATQSVACDPSATGFVYWKEDGTFLYSTTEYTGYAVLLASVITDGASVTNIVDERKFKPLRLDVSEPPSQLIATDSVFSTFTAGETIGAYKVVSASTSSEQVVLADANVEAKVPSIAISTKVVASGEKENFLTYGEIENSAWSWTINADLFLDETAGEITETAPTAENTFMQKLGKAVSPTKILFNPDNTIIEN